MLGRLFARACRISGLVGTWPGWPEMKGETPWDPLSIRE